MILGSTRKVAIALLLAFSMTLAGMPIVPTIAAGGEQAGFSLDICHPAQAVSAASIQCSLPLRLASQPEYVGVPAARWREAVIPLISRDLAPPTSPPPENSLS